MIIDKNFGFNITTYKLFAERKEEYWQIILDSLQFIQEDYPLSDIQLEFDGCFKHRDWKYNSKNLEKTKKLFFEDELEQIILKKTNFTGEAEYLLSFGYITKDRVNRLKKTPISDKELPDEISFIINKAESISDKEQIKIKSFFMNMLSKFHANTGVLGFNNFWGMLFEMTSEEKMSLQLRKPDSPLFYYDQKLRGVFWGNYLGPKFIQHIGSSIEKIKSELPFFIYEVIELASEKALYIQLTEEIHQVTDEKMMQFYNYFKPYFYDLDLENLHIRDPDKQLRKKFNMPYWL